MDRQNSLGIGVGGGEDTTAGVILSVHMYLCRIMSDLNHV